MRKRERVAWGEMTIGAAAGTVVGHGTIIATRPNGSGAPRLFAVHWAWWRRAAVRLGMARFALRGRGNGDPVTVRVRAVIPTGWR